ncbi:hypothetical protein A2U01_0116693, partial [Trifolium medium]|nr:hypothetical protein [Trifolium medium]
AQAETVNLAFGGSLRRVQAHSMTVQFAPGGSLKRFFAR